ncbi:MAG: HYR domain-containing protein, partial [Cytophagaceae bacterium]
MVFGTPTASDLVTKSPTVQLDHASGSVFAVGETSVTATATDDAGNTASCQFVVAVSPMKPNSLPVAQNVLVTTNANTSVTVMLSAVDPDGDVLTYRLVTPPAHGT